MIGVGPVKKQFCTPRGCVKGKCRTMKKNDTEAMVRDLYAKAKATVAADEAVDRGYPGKPEWDAAYATAYASAIVYDGPLYFVEGKGIYSIYSKLSGCGVINIRKTYGDPWMVADADAMSQIASEPKLTFRDAVEAIAEIEAEKAELNRRIAEAKDDAPSPKPCPGCGTYCYGDCGYRNKH